MNDDIFIKTARRKITGNPLGFKMRQKDGEVGLEIELEGNHFRRNEEGCDCGDPDCPDSGGGDGLPNPWEYHPDGSLRGYDNAEYVLRYPIPFEQVAPVVTELFGMLEEDGTVLDDSNRTSVHVHLNVQKFHLNRLCSFLALYFSVEELLTAWCGEHRVGNLFCLRANDAPAIITRLKEYFQANGDYKFSDGMHYAGLNPQAIHKFGSVEIRTLRGATEPGLIIKWVSILERLYKMSEEYPDPRTIIEMFSRSGPLGYLQTVLGPNLEDICAGSGYSLGDANTAAYSGIRRAQELCYSVRWEDFEAKTVKIDPFKRVINDEPPMAVTLGTPVATYSIQEVYDILHGSSIGSSNSPVSEPSDWFVPIPPEADSTDNF